MAQWSSFIPGYDPRLPTSLNHPQARPIVQYPNFPYGAVRPMAMRHGPPPQSDPQSAGGISAARALADHFDRVIAGWHQVLLERISRQDAVLSRQNDMLESMSRLIAAGRDESMKENESLRIQLHDIEKKTERLAKGISESMKLLAAGTIKAITECQSTIEKKLFDMEESCEGIKEELRDSQANLPEVVHHEISVGSDSPMRTTSYRAITPPIPLELSVSLSNPLPERVVSDVGETNLAPRHHSNNVDLSRSSAGGGVSSSCEPHAPGDDNLDRPSSSFQPLSYDTVNPTDALRVPRPSGMPSSSWDIYIDSPSDTEHHELPSSSVPDCHRESTPDELSLTYPSDPSRGHSQPPVASLSSNLPSSPPVTISSLMEVRAMVQGAEDMYETHLASTRSNSASAPLDSTLGSAHASPISLPEPSALLRELFSQPKNKSPQVSRPSPAMLQSRPISRAESLSSLSSLSSLDAPVLHNQILSAPVPGNLSRRGVRSRASTSPMKRRRSSPEPKRGKAAKKPRSKAKSEITKKVNKELMDGNGPASRTNKSSSANTDRQFIQCDNCELWYHWGCVGIRGDDPRLKDDEIFSCSRCQSGKTPAAPKCGQGEVCAWPDCDIETDVVEDYFIERLIGRFDQNFCGKDRFMWLVKWEGYPAEESSWTPAGELTNPAKLIQEFELAAKTEGLALSDSDLNLLQEAVESGWASRPVWE